MSESALQNLQVKRYLHAYATKVHQLCHQRDIPFRTGETSTFASAMSVSYMRISRGSLS